MEPRRKSIFLARVAEHLDRFDDMVEHMTAAVKGGPQLTQEERNLLSVAFKNAVSARRCALEFARRDEVRAKSDPQAGVYVREYMDQVRDELEHLCLAVLHLLDGSLIPAAPDSESLVFYIKMKADYHRHMATFGQRAAYAREKARQSYREAELLAVRLSVIHPVRLGLALNYSIFLRELMLLGLLHRIRRRIYCFNPCFIQCFREKISTRLKGMTRQRRGQKRAAPSTVPSPSSKAWIRRRQERNKRPWLQMSQNC